MKTLPGLQSLIVATLKARGESLLDDDGVDENVCTEIAKEVAEKWLERLRSLGCTALGGNE